MNVISTIIEYKGYPFKIIDGKVFARSFGTTIYNQNNVHWSWQEILRDNLKQEFKDFLEDNKLI